MADAVFVLYWFQPLATRSAILTFICTDRFDDGSMSLLVDLSLSCDSTAHVMMTVYAALMIIIWPVGVTCVFFVLLCRDKVRNFSGRSSTDHVLNKISKGLNTYMEVKECDFGSLFAICDRDGDGETGREIAERRQHTAVVSRRQQWCSSGSGSSGSRTSTSTTDGGS